MAYASDGLDLSTFPRSLVWVDDQGGEEVLPLPVRHYAGPRLSPDGGRVATTIFDGDAWHFWIYDVRTGAALRLTQDRGARDMTPIWTPDGERIIAPARRRRCRSVAATAWRGHSMGGCCTTGRVRP